MLVKWLYYNHPCTFRAFPVICFEWEHLQKLLMFSPPHSSTFCLLMTYTWFCIPGHTAFCHVQHWKLGMFKRDHWNKSHISWRVVPENSRIVDGAGHTTWTRDEMSRGHDKFQIIRTFHDFFTCTALILRTEMSTGND